MVGWQVVIAALSNLFAKQYEHGASFLVPGGSFGLRRFQRVFVRPTDLFNRGSGGPAIKWGDGDDPNSHERHARNCDSGRRPGRSSRAASCYAREG